MDIDYELEGKKIVIKECSFGKASKLKEAVSKLVVKNGIKLEVLFGNCTIEEMIKGILALDTDTDCHNALVDCLCECKIDDKVIIKEALMADEFIKKHYYKLVKDVFEVNISPFIEALASLLLVQ